MKKTVVTCGLTLATLGAGTAMGRMVPRFVPLAWMAAAGPAVAQPQAAEQKKGPQWKSTEEYNAFNAIVSEKDAKKRVALAEAFLQKFSNSDFKANAYVAIMQSHQQLNDAPKAIDAAKKAVEIDLDNLAALNYLSFAFPFVFKPADADAAAQLSRAETDAKHGLEVLQKLQKPQGMSDDQFNQQVKPLRANFNAAAAFVAFQRKDYPAAITAYKAATEDNPGDFYAFYRMGLAYLFSNPRDYDHAIWTMAHAVSLAQTARDPNAEKFHNYVKQTYVGYHGNDKGLSEIMAQAAASANPPEGFKVEAMETPKETGNPNIDAFNQMTFPLKLGGDKAQQVWNQLKGQPVELGGFVDSVEKGPEPGTYLVRIDILEQSKTASGVYDVELKDSTQPNVKNLKPRDAVRFKGTLTAYVDTPNLVLSVDGTITSDLPQKPTTPEKPKPTRRRTGTTHSPTP